MIMLVCLPCYLLLSGLLLSVASVSFWSCEDLFDYVHLSSSWTRSSSYRDFRQDDHYPWYHFYLCLLVVRSIAMSRYLPLVISCLSYCHVKPLTHLPSKPLFGYVTALLSPSHSVVSCRWRLKFVPCWNTEMLFLVGTCLLVGIIHYILLN